MTMHRCIKGGENEKQPRLNRPLLIFDKKRILRILRRTLPACGFTVNLWAGMWGGVNPQLLLAIFGKRDYNGVIKPM